MKAKILLYALPVLILTTIHVAEAQQPKKVPRIGFLASSIESSKSRLAAFQQGLRELGYVEGKSIVIEPRYAAGQFEKLSDMAVELVHLKVGAPDITFPVKRHITEETIPMTDMARPFRISHRGGRGRDFDRSVSVR